MDMKEQLMKKIGLEVLENELLANYTTFKIGGPAKFFVRVNNKADLFKTLKAVKEFDLPFFTLGGGSNVLVADKGFDGLVIKLHDGQAEFSGQTVKIFAGHSWAGLIRECVKKGLGGLEFGANIPGTVGGAVYGNAGAYGKGAGDYIQSVEVICLDDNEINLKILTKDDCAFNYRDSIFKKHKDWIISEIVFKLERDEKAIEKLKQIENEWQSRCDKQPLNLPSAGCSFKNVIYTGELDRFKEWEIKGKLPAAKFIEDADLKGMKIGGALVSDKHANFIVNTGNAKADDIVQLISVIKTRVRNEFGVQLEEEIQYVGF